MVRGLKEKLIYPCFEPSYCSVQDVELNFDWSSTLYMAEALMDLQTLYGPVPVVRGMGLAAQSVADNLSRLIEAAEAGTSARGTIPSFPPH